MSLWKKLLGDVATTKEIGERIPDNRKHSHNLDNQLLNATADRLDKAKKHAKMGEITKLEYNGWEDEPAEEIEWPYSRDDLELEDISDYIPDDIEEDEIVKLLDEINPEQSVVKVEKKEYMDRVGINVYTADRGDIEWDKPDRRSRARGRVKGIDNIPFGEEPDLKFEYEE